RPTAHCWSAVTCDNPGRPVDGSVRRDRGPDGGGHLRGERPLRRHPLGLLRGGRFPGFGDAVAAPGGPAGMVVVLLGAGRWHDLRALWLLGVGLPIDGRHLFVVALPRTVSLT